MKKWERVDNRAYRAFSRALEGEGYLSLASIVSSQKEMTNQQLDNFSLRKNYQMNKLQSSYEIVNSNKVNNFNIRRGSRQ